MRETPEDRRKLREEDREPKGLLKVVCDLAPIDILNGGYSLEKPCHIIYPVGSLPECEQKAYLACKKRYEQ